MIFRTPRSVAVVLLCVTALSAAKPKKTTKVEENVSADAARVAVLLYDDKTNTENFEYMPGSLKEAITQSLHAKFEFNEVDTSKIDKTVLQIKKQNKGIIGPKEAAEICRQTNVDILIYGDFTFSESTNKIEIHTNISLGSTEKFRQLAAIDNPVDATIFQAADKVATNIVAEITNVAKEQQLAKDKAATDEKGKTTLEKTDKSKTWADMNWMVSTGVGTQWPLLSNAEVILEDTPMANLNADYRLLGSWHVGLAFAYSGLRTVSRVGGIAANLEHGVGALTVGYFFDFHPRWRWTNRLGLGYFMGDFQMYREHGCENGCAPFADSSTKVNNPAVVLQTGIQFLIFSYLAVGLEARWQMLFDQTPLQGGGGLLTLTTMF